MPIGGLYQFFANLFSYPSATEEETKEKLKETDSSSSETTNVVCSQTVTDKVQRKKNTGIGDLVKEYMKDVSCHREKEEDAMKLVKALEAYSTSFTLPSGERILIRPILPTDKFVMKQLIEEGAISQQSLSLRFNAVVTRVFDSVLDYFCNVNYDSHFAVSVLMEENGEWKGVASGRFIQDETCPSEAEWAALVVDAKHGHKIGSCILYYLGYMSHQFGIEQLMAVVHPNNYCVLYWMNKLSAYRVVKDECYYWAFKTPLYEEWIKNPEIRKKLESASSGHGELPEELEQVVLTCSEFVYIF